MSERQEGYFVQERYVSHPRQPWEYLQEEIPQIQWQTRLTELGAEGWELVHQIWVERFGPLDVGESWQTATVKMEGWRCFFKRPKGA